jgi:hypothetical protein
LNNLQIFSLRKRSRLQKCNQEGQEIFSEGEKNMRRKQRVLFLIGILLIASPLWAGVIPGKWEKVDTMPEGAQIRVETFSEEKFNAQLVATDPESILIRDETGEERRLPKSLIKKVTSTKRVESDSLAEGAVAGAVVGGLGSIIPAVMVSSETGSRSVTAGLVMLCTGIGAGIGIAVDAAVKSREVYYQAPKQ